MKTEYCVQCGTSWYMQAVSADKLPLCWKCQTLNAVLRTTNTPYPGVRWLYCHKCGARKSGHNACFRVISYRNRLTV